jgi:hypothetical protein
MSGIIVNLHCFNAAAAEGNPELHPFAVLGIFIACRQ